MTKPQTSSDKLVDVITGADVKLLRQFLKQILQANDQLAQQFMQQISTNKLSQSGQTKYRDQLAALLNEYLDEDNEANYYDDYDNDDPTSEIYTFLDKAITELTDLGSYSIAFALIKQLIETTESSTVGVDDDYGLIATLADDATSLIMKLLTTATLVEKQAMFPWFIQQVEQYPGEYFYAQLQAGLQKEFTEPVFLEKELVTAKALISQASDLDDWNHDLTLDFWLPFQVKLMGKLALPLAEITAFARDNWQYADVRTQYAELLINKKAYDQAVVVLKESLRLDHANWDDIRQNHLQLKRIYQLTDQLDKYRQQLQAILAGDALIDFDILHELKASYQPQDWQPVCQKLFAKLSTHSGVDRFYVEEQRHDLLLTYVLNISGLGAVQHYLETLKTAYPQQLLEKYQTELRKMATPVSNRTEYALIAKGLSQMATIPNGKQPAQALQTEFLTNYSRCPAMRDELGHVSEQLK